MPKSQEKQAPHGPEPVTVSLRVAIRREIDRGTSLRQIARDTGIPAGNLSRLVSGDREFRGVHIDALAAYLGMRLTKPRKR